jgi:hypothetical protein
LIPTQNFIGLVVSNSIDHPNWPFLVGGGSIVNQALLDRFDDMAFAGFKEKSSVSFFTKEQIRPWYEKAEAGLVQRELPSIFKNRNAEIFEAGFEKDK